MEEGKTYGTVEDRDANMSKITKRDSKVLGCEVGRLPIHKINNIRSAMENSHILYLPSLHEVRYYRDTMMAFYISLFIFLREVLVVLMVPIGTEGGVWGCRKRLNGGRGCSWKHTYG